MMDVQFGLRNEEACCKLREVLENVLLVESHLTENVLGNQRFLRSWHCRVSSMLSLIGVFAAAAAMVVLVASLISASEINSRFWSSILEVIILLICTLATCFVTRREDALRASEVRRLLKEVCDRLLDCSELQSCDDFPDLLLPRIPSISLTWTFRDNKLLNLPSILLVEGDVVVLGPSQAAPARCKLIASRSSDRMSPGLSLSAGDVFDPSLISEDDGDADLEPKLCQPFPRSMFEVLDAPATGILNQYADILGKKKMSVFNTIFQEAVFLVETRVLWVILAIGLTVGLLRWKLMADVGGNCADMVVKVLAITVLPLLPIAYPVFWMATSMYGTARLRALFSGALQREATADDDEESRDVDVSVWQILKQMLPIIKGDACGLPRVVDLLHSLSSITALCCVDKEGVLCYPNPVAEKVFVFKHNDETLRCKELADVCGDSNKELVNKVGVAETQFDKEHANGEEHGVLSENNVEIMTLSTSSMNSTSLSFDDPDWEREMTSLKPLGLSILLTSPCAQPVKNARLSDFLGHLSLSGNRDVVQNFHGCLCPLASQVGFDHHLASPFKQQQQIATFQAAHVPVAAVESEFFLTLTKEKKPPAMVSTLLSYDNQGIQQLFSHGSADIILDACSDLWNGDGICTLNSYDRRRAMNFFQRMDITGHCIAFSYRPLESALANIEPDDRLELAANTKNKIMNLNSPTDKDLTCRDLLKTQSVPRGVLLPSSALNEHIFLGMVTLVNPLKEDVMHMVETVVRAGIRFVHFSYENELLSRVFCQRLGLETGWNCHISLGETSGLTLDESSSAESLSEMTPMLADADRADNAPAVSATFGVNLSCDVQSLRATETASVKSQAFEDYDELYFMSNRSKLPKGIQNIRPHLQEVDDVPLLVPLFTDCKPAAVADMMKIMQEQGEIVCCLGSSMNVHNSAIFAQADISIGLFPLFPRICLRNQDSTKSFENPLLSANENDHIGLAVQLNALPCSLLCQRQQNFPLASLLREARRLAVGVNSCFTYMLSAHLSLSILHLLCSVFLLPPVLSGIQTLWLLLVIIPLLSLSLLHAPGDKQLMKEVTGKRRSPHQKLPCAAFIEDFVPTFFLNSLFLASVIFPWVLHSVCRQARRARGGDCHWLFGLRERDQRWAASHIDGLAFGQEFSLCITTLTLIALSAKFADRKRQIWEQPPWRNKAWFYCGFLCIILQSIYTSVSISIWSDPASRVQVSLLLIPIPVYFLLSVWLALLIAFGELLKRRRVRQHARFQKRERLKFDTKLGMNSPV